MRSGASRRADRSGRPPPTEDIYARVWRRVYGAPYGFTRRHAIAGLVVGVVILAAATLLLVASGAM